MSDVLLALLLVAATLVALGVATALHLRFWERRLSVQAPYGEEHRLSTPDGSAIELRRIPPDAPAVDAPPVLLVHGLGANHRNLDVHPRLSLARHLASAGRDVWLLTLRAGRHDRLPGERGRRTFAAMARHDVPVAVATVLARTGARALDYVGFSMGGMLLYACVGNGVPEASLRRVVVIGAPARVGSPVPLLGRLSPGCVPGIAFRGPGRLLAFLVDHVRTPIHRLVYHPENAAPGLAAVAMMDTLADLPGELHRELALMGRAGGALRVGEREVLPALRRVGVPALFVAGNADRLAPPASVRAAYDAWGADHDPPPAKSLEVLGDDRVRYGHGDLVLGRDLVTALFARVEAFLAAP